jgi:glycosyltransferase involved in cell wall biosynthesis
VRVLVYVDSVYRRVDGAVYSDVSFTSFLAALTGEMDVTIIGRLTADDGSARYRIPDGVRFVALPHYESLSDLRAALGSLGRSLRTFSTALDDADVTWLFGPYLHSQLFAALALLRRRRVVLGVRQHFPDYVRARRPDRRWMHLAADLLEAGWRIWARRLPTVVVGPALAHNYRHAAALLPIAVSLVSNADIEAGERAPQRAYDHTLQILSVGRLDEEKNPLLMADVLAQLHERDQRWCLVVCGEGTLAAALAGRLRDLGVADATHLRGHVGLQDGLWDLYRTSQVFLHISRTEGFPQVLVEAFASGIPVVATAVGGVRAAAAGAALLIEPDDADAAAQALTAVASDPELRAQLVASGFAKAHELTREAEIERVAAFLRE